MMRPSEIRSRRQRAFSLVEILTALTITSVIVVALVSMFNTSTKALLAANRQTDIWEAARSSFGLIESDVAEVTLGGATNRANLFANGNATSIIAHDIIGNVTNRLQEIYVLSREGGIWGATVYRVVREDVNDGIGTLYRFQTNYAAYSQSFTSAQLPIDAPLNDFAHPLRAVHDPMIDPSLNQFKKMVEGVIHLRLVPFAADGRAFTNSNTLATMPEDHRVFDDSFVFWNQSLPAFVDLELFVLEPDRIEEFRAQAGVIARQNYLNRHLGNIQIFRTRIPVRRDAYALK